MLISTTASSQVPYETLNKRFRAAQKNIDRETSHVTMVVAELEKTLSSFPVVDSVVSLLDGVVEKLSALKRKVRNAVVHLTVGRGSQRQPKSHGSCFHLDVEALRFIWWKSSSPETKGTGFNWSAALDFCGIGQVSSRRGCCSVPVSLVLKRFKKRVRWTPTRPITLQLLSGPRLSRSRDVECVSVSIPYPGTGWQRMHVTPRARVSWIFLCTHSLISINVSYGRWDNAILYCWYISDLALFYLTPILWKFRELTGNTCTQNLHYHWGSLDPHLDPVDVLWHSPPDSTRLSRCVLL